jgi:hypothetical protein
MNMLQAEKAVGKMKIDDLTERDRQPGLSGYPLTGQAESPLYALINRREACLLDELPGEQLESPLNALLNHRRQRSLAAQSNQMESPLSALINHRKPLSLGEAAARIAAAPLYTRLDRHHRCS